MPTSPQRLNRADLLRALKQPGGDALDTVAEYSGSLPRLESTTDLAVASTGSINAIST